jgi:hypothetical protein
MSNATQEVNKRIQYSHDDEPSSLTIKTSLLDLLAAKKGTEKEAKKFCQVTAAQSKDEGVGKGGVSNAVFISALKQVLAPKILNQMTEDDFTKEVNVRIQYTYDQEPSSLTIKHSLFKALSLKLGSDALAKKFCQKTAIDAKDGDIDKGKLSNFVFEAVLTEVKSTSL